MSAQNNHMNDDKSKNQVRIALLSDLVPSTAIRVDVEDSTGTSHRIAIVRIEDDVYAIGDRCSHADVSLALGTVWVDECQLECEKHGSAFSLITGKPATFPATRPVPVYVVTVLNNEVFVELS
jgi:3-phenylpropionate/trans-cinnamate dioxygenase ferredoxin component